MTMRETHPFTQFLNQLFTQRVVICSYMEVKHNYVSFLKYGCIQFKCYLMLCYEDSFSIAVEDCRPFHSIQAKRRFSTYHRYTHQNHILYSSSQSQRRK